MGMKLTAVDEAIEEAAEEEEAADGIGMGCEG